MGNLKLEVILQAVDRLTAPLKRAAAGSTATARAVKDLRDRMRELNRAQSQIEGFRTVARQAAIVGNNLRVAQERVRTLAQQMAASASPSRQLTREFEAARKAASALKTQHTELLTKQQRLRSALDAAGHSTRQLAEYQRRLKTDTTVATTALAREELRLKQLAAQAARMQAARNRYERTLQTRNRMAGAGTSMVAGGVVAGGPVVKTVKDYVSFEDAMLGVARQVQGARDDNGKLTSTYYEMAAAIKQLAEGIPLATTEIAAIVEAGARMGIQGRENLIEFARVTAITATAFDLPVDQIGEDMGKLAELYKVPIKSISELGDVINWLDDNALSKGGDIIDVMKRIAGTAASVKMPYREAAALGSTFLSLGASAEIAATASNALLRELAIAAQQPKRFQKGLEALGLNAKKIQRDMARDATGTIIQVLEAINRLKQEDQLTVTTQLFGKEYGDDAAKLANNLKEYRRQLELVRAAQAKGSMQREAAAKADTLSARWQMLTNRAFNLSSAIGETLKPTLIALMNRINGVLDAGSAWATANPELVSTLAHVAAIVAVTVTGLGGLALAAAAVLGPFALLRFSLAALGIKSSGALATLWRLAGGAIPAIGRGLLWLGRLAMGHPLIATVALLAGGALYVWQHWEQIGPWFAALWNSIKSTWDSFWGGARLAYTLAAAELKQTWNGIKSWFAELWQSVKQTAVAQWDSLLAYLSALPERMLAIGRDIIDGIIRGIQEKWQALKDMISGVGDMLPAWLRDKLDTHSPSRVFAAIGSDLLAGLGVGMDGQQAPLLAQVGALAKRLAQAGAGIALGTAPLVAGAVPTLQSARPPITAATTGTGPEGGESIVINVYPSAGMDERRLAREVALQLDRARRADAARSRSALYDQE